jgi:hypothetical protein
MTKKSNDGNISASDSINQLNTSESGGASSLSTTAVSRAEQPSDPLLQTLQQGDSILQLTTTLSQVSTAATTTTTTTTASQASATTTSSSQALLPSTSSSHASQSGESISSQLQGRITEEMNRFIESRSDNINISRTTRQRNVSVFFNQFIKAW